MTEEQANIEKTGKRVFTPDLKLAAVLLVQQGHTKAKVSRMKNVPESTLRGWCKNYEKLKKQASPEEQIKASLQERASICEASPEGVPPKKLQKLDEEVLDLSIKTGNQNCVKTPESRDNFAELQRIRIECGFNQQEVPAYERPINLWQMISNTELASPFFSPSQPHLNTLLPLNLQELNTSGAFRLLPTACSNQNPAAMTIQARSRNVLSEVQPTYPVPVFGYDQSQQKCLPEVHNRRFMIHPRKCLDSKRPNNKKINSETMTRQVPVPGHVGSSTTSRERDNSDRPEIYRSSTPIFKGYKNPKTVCCESQQPPDVQAPELPAPSEQKEIREKNPENHDPEASQPLPEVVQLPHSNERTDMEAKPSSRKRSLQSITDRLGTESHDRSLEESLSAESVEEFSPEEALKQGELFLKAMQTCSNPSFSRKELQTVEGLVEKLRQISGSK